MGATQSNLTPMPHGFDYMTVTFKLTNKIRLIYPTEQDICITREVLMEHLPNGIKHERPLLGSAHEFKLNGDPFWGMPSSKETIRSRKLAADLLFRYYNQGLKLIISSDLAQTTDLTTWIFHREIAATSKFGFACICIGSTDKLLFIGFPSALHQFFQTVVSQNWPETIQRVKIVGDTLVVKLFGNPWFSEDDSESIQSRILITALITALGQNNWLLYGTINFKDTGDTIFFRYDPNSNADESRQVGFAISLSKKDRLQVIDSIPQVVHCVRRVLLQHWPIGLQKQMQKINAEEFILNGTPWWSNGKAGVSARLIMCKLLEALMSIGWRVQIAIDVTIRRIDKCIFTFQQCVPTFAQIFCLSFNYTDRIRFINAPPDVIEVVSAEIRKNWHFGIGKEGPYGTSREIKLTGNPWSDEKNGHDGAHGRVLLCHILKVCASIGWYLIISGDISTKYAECSENTKSPIDVHSWWFMQIAPPSQQFATAPSVAPSQFVSTQCNGAGYTASTVNSGIGLDLGFSPNPPPYSEPFK